MPPDQWTAVDRYITDHLVPPDPVLTDALKANADAGLPAIDVAPNQGKLLHLLAHLRGARRILEIGTLGGYSSIWLARALPDGGRLITLEVDAKHADVARSNFARAGLSNVIELRLGPAVESLEQLYREKTEPFDMVFIDADKQTMPVYLNGALKLTRSGSLLVFDNVIREGAILDPDNADPAIVGTRKLFDLLGAEPRVTATAIQTVGSKGYDGFAIAVVVSD